MFNTNGNSIDDPCEGVFLNGRGGQGIAPCRREQSLSEPLTGFNEHTGNEMPEDAEISIVENQGNTPLTLPDSRDPEAVLEEEDVEDAAEGEINPDEMIDGSVGAFDDAEGLND